MKTKNQRAAKAEYNGKICIRKALTNRDNNPIPSLTVTTKLFDKRVKRRATDDRRTHTHFITVEIVISQTQFNIASVIHVTIDKSKVRISRRTI